MVRVMDDRTEHIVTGWLMRVFQLLMLRLRSLRRPTVVVALLSIPVLMAAIFMHITNMSESGLGDPFLDLLYMSLQQLSVSLSFQAALSSILMVDILGGDTKHNEDLTLLSTIPIRNIDQFVADLILGIIVAFTQVGILTSAVVVFCASVDTVYLIPTAIGVLLLGAIGPTLLIVALTELFIESLSGTVAYLTVPLTFVSWRMLIMFIALHYEVTWFVFVIPSTMIQVLVASALGTAGHELLAGLYLGVPEEYLVHAADVLWGITLVGLAAAFAVRHLKQRISRA